MEGIPSTLAKRRAFIHLLLGSRHLSPRLQWRFKSEDFVGQVSRVTRSISKGVASARLSQNLAAKYRVLLRFIISNERFKLAGKSLCNLDLQQDPEALRKATCSVLGKGSLGKDDPKKAACVLDCLCLGKRLQASTSARAAIPTSLLPGTNYVEVAHSHIT